MSDWFSIVNIDETDTPALVVYKERVKQNISFAKEMIGDVNRLRPHVKTNKMAEVCRMMTDAGITKFKCATIAEAEMLGMITAPDVLLAYQPVGPKMKRLITLIKTYPETVFSCLLDNEKTAEQLNRLCKENSVHLNVFIDVNVGMNRTGIHAENALPLVLFIAGLSRLYLSGFHGYDGHVRDTDLSLRKQHGDEAINPVEKLADKASEIVNHPLTIVAGGTPSFPVHAQRKNIECSPGTFVFSDWGYHHSLSDEPFIYAALVVSRIISVIDEETVCADLGHKSVAAENPLPRVHFLNAPNVVPVSQSEEHLVLKVPSGHHYQTGDILYGVPVHICPTVALYEKAYVVENKTITGSWKVVARDRMITV